MGTEYLLACQEIRPACGPAAMRYVIVLRFDSRSNEIETPDISAGSRGYVALSLRLRVQAGRRGQMHAFENEINYYGKSH